MKKLIALLLMGCMVLSMTACGGNTAAPTTAPTAAATEAATEAAETTQSQEEIDKAAADAVAELIDAIYVQTRNEDTDAQCEQAKAAWDALTDAQKELVEGEEASPEYFGRDTGDAKLDDPRNQDEIGEKELLVVSFGTSFNDSRATDIKGIEDALAKAFPDWSVRRAFTAQIIINHVQARDGEKIDNMDQALERAVANGVKTLVVQPTHLMHGAEYDEMCEALDAYKDKIENIVVAEPLLGEVGNDATVINADKEAVAKAVVAAAVADGNFESIDKAAEDGTALVLMGHGTAHVAKVTYSQMQTQMEKLGYKNVFIGTVEGEPEETSCEAVIEAVKAAGYTKVALRPLMVVAGDHANNDMAGADEDSWKSMVEAAGLTVECQIAGLGRIGAVQELYVAHTQAAIDTLK
ncbi:MAG: cobalt chelatase [Clostridiales bacterium]|nr:cobalt chelatase [Clostridiales bacterium]